jgi:hypothetical protein
MTQEGVEVHPKKTHEGLVILENFPKGGGKKDRGGEFLEELFKGGAQQGTLIRSIPPLAFRHGGRRAGRGRFWAKEAPQPQQKGEKKGEGKG